MSQAAHTELADALKNMRRKFLIPLDDSVFDDLDTRIAEAATDYCDVGRTFRHSLASIHSTVTLPFTLASASVQGSHWQRIYAAERIRERGREVTGTGLEETRDAEAIAKDRVREFLKSKEGVDQITLDLCSFLLDGLAERQVDNAAQELLQNGTSLLWSAFEILCRDIFEVHLNTKPSAVQVLVAHTSTRKRFEADKFTLDLLARHDFDLSTRMGSILAEQHDLSDLPTIKAVYGVLFPSNGELIDALADRELWILSQHRHLFVHRRGVVDQAYLDNTGENLSIGSKLVISPREFEKYFHLVTDLGVRIMEAVPDPDATP